MKTLFRYLVCAGLMAQAAQAATLPEGLRINGFLTGALTYGSEDAGYLNDLIRDDVRADIRDTRLGLQVSADITDRIGLTAQMLARGGATDRYDVELDWGYASLRLRDDIALRAGKVKLPTFLVSDYIEVGYAYPWIRPPQEVYALNPITSLTGLDLLYQPTMGDIDVLVQPYFGSSNGDGVVPPALVDTGAALVSALAETPVSLPAGSQALVDAASGLRKGDEVDFEATDFIGINVAVTRDWLTLRAGYLRTKVDADFPVEGVIRDDQAQLYGVGFSADYRNIVAYGEYVERDEDDALEFGFPDQKAWYLTLGYRLGRFLPHLSYAAIREGRDEADIASLLQGLPLGAIALPQLAAEQSSVTAGVRYELAEAAALKAEVQHANPESDSYGLFDDPVDDGLLYSIALDLIF